MKTIALSRGKFALVDDADYAALMQGPKWQAVSARKTFYATRTYTENGKTARHEKMHRLILGITDPLIKTDHQDGDGLNNQRHNLRRANDSQSQCNQAIAINNTSGVRGVSNWHGRWRVLVTVNGKRNHVGYFATLSEAAAARKAAEIKHHKEFSASLSRG